MKWALLVVGVGVAGFVVYRVIVAQQAGVSVGAALARPAAPPVVLRAVAMTERKANTGAGHF